MKKIKLFVALFFCAGLFSTVAAPTAFAAKKSSKHHGKRSVAKQAAFEDRRSAEFKRAILANDFNLDFAGSKPFKCYDNDLCVSDYSLFVAALSELYLTQQVKKVDVENWLDWMIDEKTLNEADLIHFVWSFRDVLTEEWSRVFASLYDFANRTPSLDFVDPKIKYIIQEEIDYATLVPVDLDRVQMARDLMSKAIDASRYKNGEYDQALQLFMFCRDDRRFPCLLVMRDTKGRLVRKKDGAVWSHQLLGYSRHSKKYNEVSGNTPAGVYTVDGVMPAADQKEAYGEWRRLILNFIPRSGNEAVLRSLLPSSSHTAHWWHESVIARNMGRSAFRIHGTKQPAPLGEPYFPFYGTSGCIANRENKYNGVNYKDQRIFLDKLMTEMNMSAVYANEVKIKALLYVMNIDNAQKWVSLEDLKALRIL